MKKSKPRKTEKRAAGFDAFVARRKDELPADVEILQREIKSLRTRLHKGKGKADLVVAAVRTILEENPIALPPIKAPKLDRRGGSEETAVLHYSDPQFGKITESYDSAVASRRAEMFAQKAVQIAEIRRSAYPVREARLYVGGDIVEGETIFPHQAHLIDQPLIEQACSTAPMAIARMVRYLLANFEKVRVVCVPGNHGRSGKFNDPRTNWDMVACLVAKLMLSDADGKLLPRLEFESPGSFYVVDRIYGWGNLVVHGHQINGGFAGFPWYGVGKKAAGWADTIKDPWDYLWFGHFHTYTSGALNHRQFLANGTTESDNEFALEQLAAAGHPCQRLAFFNAKFGLISDNPIWLTNERVSQSGRWERWVNQQKARS